MEALPLILIVLLVLAAAGFGIWGIMRWRYVQSLRDKGWEFITSPDISIVHGLNVPPFGVGFGRSVDDQVVGRAPDGTPFSAFRYKSSNWSTAGYAVAVPLPHSMPAGEITHAAGTQQLQLPGHRFTMGPISATARDAAYAEELLTAVAPALTGPWRVSVDHTNLILVDVSREVDQLDRAVTELAAVRAALLNSPAALRHGPTPPPALGFYERPGWTYVPSDNSYLRYIGHTTGGRNHRASDIVFSDNAGLPFLRLRHDWETTRTVRDSQGRTRTVTDHHTEILGEFRMDFPFRPISVNWGWFGKGQQFELEEFNDRVKVKSPHPRFASDVIHQRQMEYLLQCGHPRFSIEADGRIRVEAGDWLPHDIDRADALLRGFFARVPDFVWTNLGLAERPIPEITG